MSGELTAARANARPYYRRHDYEGQLEAFTLTMRVTSKELECMKINARVRNISLSGLARIIMERVLKDDLIKAILDD
jgi:hypothetical protein